MEHHACTENMVMFWNNQIAILVIDKMILQLVQNKFPPSSRFYSERGQLKSRQRNENGMNLFFANMIDQETYSKKSKQNITLQGTSSVKNKEE
jgi:hypothetical protein